MLIERMAQLGHDHHFTVTATTRDPRPGEKDGVHHHFVSRDTFFNMVAKDELLEWAQVYGNYYGVPKQQVRDALAAGRHIIIRVDVQGARRLRQIVPDALFIFIQPPSIETLREHLLRRRVNSAADLETRLAAADLEMREASRFDYSVLNREGALDSTVADVVKIIDTEAVRVPPRSVVV